MAIVFGAKQRYIKEYTGVGPVGRREVGRKEGQIQCLWACFMVQRINELIGLMVCIFSLNVSGGMRYDMQCARRTPAVMSTPMEPAPQHMQGLAVGVRLVVMDVSDDAGHNPLQLTTSAPTTDGGMRFLAKTSLRTGKKSMRASWTACVDARDAPTCGPGGDRRFLQVLARMPQLA